MTPYQAEVLALKLERLDEVIRLLVISQRELKNSIERIVASTPGDRDLMTVLLALARRP